MPGLRPFADMKSSKEFSLQICGRGAVSPLGVGIESLLMAGTARQEEMALLSRPERKVPVFRVDLKQERWKRWQKEPRLRRASPIALFMAEAADQAMQECPEAREARIGLVAAFGTGSIVYSRKFFSDFSRLGRNLASPALFPETVYNSPASHLAALLGLGGMAYSLAGDETAWVEALRVAKVWLALDQADYVLVVGAEELDAAAVEAYARSGWMRKGGAFRPSEGASAILLGRERNQAKPVVFAAETGWPYRSAKGAAAAADRMWGGIPDEAMLYPSAAANPLGPLEAQKIQDRAVSHSFSHAGEAFAASAGWHAIRACSCLEVDGIPVAMPVWGLNQQLGWVGFRL